MNKFIRLYNQNRVFIWITIIAIIFIIIAIQILNDLALENIKNKNKILNSNIVNKEEIKDNLDIDIIIDDEEVKEEKELIIDQFIRYCHAKEIEKAYSLLSNDCKEELFPTLDDFKEKYYYKLFNTKKLYSKEVFYNNTYKVKYYDDMLATGKINDEVIEDYYTIQKENNETKLNISNFIYKMDLNRQKTINNLKIKVLEKQVYTEYEEYKLEVTNLTDKKILLDSKEKTKTMYLLGDKDVKLYCLSHEISIDELTIEAKSSKIIRLKFNKGYNVKSNTQEEINLTDIIYDYEEYKSLDKKSEYKNRGSITI